MCVENSLTVYAVHFWNTDFEGSWEGPFLDKDVAIGFAKGMCTELNLIWEKSTHSSIERLVTNKTEPRVWIDSVILHPPFSHFMYKMWRDKTYSKYTVSERK